MPRNSIVGPSVLSLSCGTAAAELIAERYNRQELVAEECYRDKVARRRALEPAGARHPVHARPITNAWDLAAYQFASITTRRVRKKTVTTYKPIRLTSAAPASSPMASMVSLVPASKPNLAQSDRLQIVAADLTDAYGRPLDGNQPGGNYVAIVSGNGATPAAKAGPTTIAARAVDAVIERHAKVAKAHRSRNFVSSASVSRQVGRVKRTPAHRCAVARGIGASASA